MPGMSAGRAEAADYGLKCRGKAPALAVPREVSFPNNNNGLGWITAPNRLFDLKRVSGGMANRSPPNGETKNPGSLAGDTGAQNGSASRQDRAQSYTTLRSIFNDDGHFIGLEVAHG